MREADGGTNERMGNKCGRIEGSRQKVRMGKGKEGKGLRDEDEKEIISRN
jgi:hypothetical protein